MGTATPTTQPIEQKRLEQLARGRPRASARGWGCQRTNSDPHEEQQPTEHKTKDAYPAYPAREVDVERVFIFPHVIHDVVYRLARCLGGRCMIQKDKRVERRGV